VLVGESALLPGSNADSAAGQMASGRTKRRDERSVAEEAVLLHRGVGVDRVAAAGPDLEVQV
jgi:hypothetical protein